METREPAESDRNGGMPMDIKQMTYILAIAEEGGITKAADKLFLTQSALDQQLLKLEDELGVPLFYRARNHFSLTSAGEVYVKYAKQVLRLISEADFVIHDIADQQKGTLSFAFVPERGSEMFMAVYPDFYKKYPGIRAVPREINGKTQLLMLQNDELDFGFILIGEESIPGVVCRPIVKEEFVLIAPASHPLAKLAGAGRPIATLDIERLRGVPISLMYRGSTQRTVIDPLFEKRGFKPDIFLEATSNRVNVSLVEKGLCCSIVPYYYVHNNRNVACFRLDGMPAWNMSVCHRRGRYLGKAAEYFISMAADYFRKATPPI